MRFKILILISAIIFVIAGCEKETTADLSKVSKPAVITLKGDNPFFLGVGNPFEDPGVTVKNGTLDKVVENISPTLTGSYFVEYVAKNADGLITTKRRSVNALENQTPMGFDFSSGMYSCTLVKLREGVKVSIKKVATGVIYCSDIFLGYYTQVRGLPNQYAVPVILNHKGGGVWEVLETPISPWGAVNMSEITITENSTSWKLENDGYTWGGNAFIGNLISK